MAVILIIKANFLIRIQDQTRMIRELSGRRRAGGTDLDWAEREQANACIEEQGKDRDEPTAHGFVIVRVSALRSRVSRLTLCFHQVPQLRRRLPVAHQKCAGHAIHHAYGGASRNCRDHLHDGGPGQYHGLCVHRSCQQCSRPKRRICSQPIGHAAGGFCHACTAMPSSTPVHLPGSVLRWLKYF